MRDPTHESSSSTDKRNTIGEHKKRASTLTLRVNCKHNKRKWNSFDEINASSSTALVCATITNFPRRFFF